MTKPLHTRRRGNGGKRLNKVEKDNFTDVLANRGKFNGRGPCGWTEGGQSACLWRGDLIDGMCAEHRSEMLRIARVKRWQEGRAKTSLPAKVLPDHSAPWRCQKVECKVCVDKPTYEEWVRKRNGS